MRKQKSVLTIVLTLVLSFNVSAMSVLAAPQTMPDGTVFDPEYYAGNNPDVVAALGTTTEALYQHYVTFGKNEGRKAYADAKTTKDILDELREKYPTGSEWTSRETMINNRYQFPIA